MPVTGAPETIDVKNVQKKIKNVKNVIKIKTLDKKRLSPIPNA